jgi:two-component system nitrate/nitrite response regulator NarL
MDIQLVVADHHPLMLQGLGNLFQTEEEFKVVALCRNALETMEAVRLYRPDVLVLATNVPGKDSLTIARELLVDTLLPTRIVFYAEEIDENQLMDTIRVGVAGIVLKEMDPQLLIQCVRKVHKGEQWMERRAARLSLEKLLRREAGVRDLTSHLTPREIEIMRLVSEGLSNKDIGEQMCISEGTVKVHLHNIYEKLQLKSRMALLRYAQEKGLVDSITRPVK